MDVKKQLATTLSWLAHGSDYFELADGYDVGKTTVHSIIHRVIDTLYEKLVPDAIVFPKSDPDHQQQNLM